MEKVSLVDISGYQWEIEDVNAHKRIDELETKTTVKRTELWRKGNSYIEMIEHNGLVFYNGSFKDDVRVSSIGELVFTITPGKQTKELIQVCLAGDKKDYTGRVPIFLNISKNGNVRAYPIVENALSGEYTECTIFGDFFQLVN